MFKSDWSEDTPFKQITTLSILDLIESKTLDFKLASLLWLIMESRASVMIASEPVFAGKTTLLHALLDFLPPDLQLYFLQGFAEDFVFVDRYKPETTYLVSEEISNHQYEYLWGRQVQKTFRLLGSGYRLGTTIHAGNIIDVAYLLHSFLKVPLSNIARLGIVVTLYAANGPTCNDEPIRRIHTVTIFYKEVDKLTAQTLAVRESLDGGFKYPEENVLQEALFNKFGVKCERVFSELLSREAFLKHLYETGIRSPEEVRKAITTYHRSSLR
jgi:hypothetical protein